MYPAETRVRRGIVNDAVVARAAEADLVLDEAADLALRELRHDPGAESELGDPGDDVQLRAAGAFLERLALGEALLPGRGEAQKDLAEAHHVKFRRFQFKIHGLTS